MLLNLIARVFGQKRRHLATFSYPGLLNLAFDCDGQHLRPYEVNEVVKTSGCAAIKNSVFKGQSTNPNYRIPSLLKKTEKI